MDKMNKKEYQNMQSKKIPKPTYFKNILFAFFSRRNNLYIGTNN